MTTGNGASAVPAIERLVVGLCHDLNDQLAAVAAYAYLLDRRGQLGDMAPALHDHVDRLAHSVRLIRSLCRPAEPAAEPVALSVLASSASELMAAYPEGPVVFEPLAGEESTVIRCDWTRTIRATLVAGAWIARGIDESVTVALSAQVDEVSAELRLRATEALERGPAEELVAEPGSCGITISPAGDREAVIRFPRPQ